MNIINDNGFVKSNFIKVYPNAYRGRNSDKIVENNPVPFDPESRLNTEKNYRNTSAIVGKKTFMIDAGSTTYYNPEETGESVGYYHIYFCLQGYKFEIFCQETDYNELLNTTTPYYAKIKINSSKELFGNHRTEILENLYGTNTDECLDNKINNDYYFCGLQITNSVPWARSVTEEEKLFGYNSNTGYYYIRLVGKDSEADPINIRVMKQKLYYNTDSKDINFTDRNLDFTGAELTWKDSTVSAEAYTTDFGIKNSLIYSKALDNSQTSYVWVTPGAVEITGGGEDGLNSPTALKVANDYITTTVTTINGLGLSTISSDSTSGLTLTTTKENIKLNGIEISKDSGETNTNFVDLKNYKLTGTNNTVTIDNKLNVPIKISAGNIDATSFECPIYNKNFKISRGFWSGEYGITVAGTDGDYTPFSLFIGGKKDSSYDGVRLVSNFYGSTLKFSETSVYLNHNSEIKFSGDDFIIGHTRYIQKDYADKILHTILADTEFISDNLIDILDITLKKVPTQINLFEIDYMINNFMKDTVTVYGGKKIVVRFEPADGADIRINCEIATNQSKWIVPHVGHYLLEIYPCMLVGNGIDSSGTQVFNTYTLPIKEIETTNGSTTYVSITKCRTNNDTCKAQLETFGYDSSMFVGAITFLAKPEIVCVVINHEQSFCPATKGDFKTDNFGYGQFLILSNIKSKNAAVYTKLIPMVFSKMHIHMKLCRNRSGFGRNIPYTVADTAFETNTALALTNEPKLSWSIDILYSEVSEMADMSTNTSNSYIFSGPEDANTTMFGELAGKNDGIYKTCAFRLKLFKWNDSISSDYYWFLSNGSSVLTIE